MKTFASIVREMKSVSYSEQKGDKAPYKALNTTIRSLYAPLNTTDDCKMVETDPHYKKEIQTKIIDNP